MKLASYLVISTTIFILLSNLSHNLLIYMAELWHFPLITVPVSILSIFPSLALDT